MSTAAPEAEESHRTHRRGFVAQHVLIVHGLTPGFAWMAIGPEFGSLWCWGASSALVGALLEKPLARWAEKCHDASRAAAEQAGSSTCEGATAVTSVAVLLRMLGGSIWCEMMGPRALLAEWSRRPLPDGKAPTLR